MKKALLILGILGVTVLLFSHGFDRGSGRGTDFRRGYMMEDYYAEKNLSDAEYKKLTLMRNKHFKENEKLLIEIRSKELAIDKLTIQDNVDWDKVDKLNSDKYKLVEKLENKRLRHREELKKEFGDKFFGNGYMRGRRGRHMMDDYDGHHMRRY